MNCRASYAASPTDPYQRWECSLGDDDHAKDETGQKRHQARGHGRDVLMEWTDAQAPDSTEWEQRKPLEVRSPLLGDLEL